MAEKSTKHYSSIQEKMVAKELGGYQVGGSGAFPTAPGDVTTYEWLIECKTHTEPGHTIFFDLDVWKKIQQEAMAMHRKPVLIVDDGSQSVDKTWCLCRSANLNKASIIATPFPRAIRKNVSAKHEVLRDELEKATKRYIGEFFQGGVYEFDWGGETVNLMPLTVFKEIFEK